MLKTLGRININNYLMHILKMYMMFSEVINIIFYELDKHVLYLFMFI